MAWRRYLTIVSKFDLRPNMSQRIGGMLLGAIAVAGPFVSVWSFFHRSSSLPLSIAVTVLVPLLVSLTMVAYVVKYYHHRNGETLLVTGSVGSLLMIGLYAFTARSIIWGQQTLGVVMKDQVIMVTEMALGGSLFGLLIGHYYGLALIQRRRLSSQRDQLRRQNKRLEAFASVVSHDLRNPLNVVMGRLELAAQQVDNDHLSAAARACDRMVELIEGLLALSRAEESVIELSTIDLSSLIEHCWDHVATEDATLVVKTARPILADRSRLQQLLENLIRNAVEHGGQDVKVTIGELDDGFYVEDDGVGVPEEYDTQVFTRGFSTVTDGTGFGLAIVVEIARDHDWDFALAEGAEGGARFEFTNVASSTR